MATVTGGHRFEISHKSGTPEDPNLCSADDIAAYMLIDSVAISTATSKAVSTVNAAAPDSSSISQARSQAVSAASVGSVADSKSVSNSVNISVADSKAISVSGSTSQADSKAVSVSNSVPILTVVAASQSVSIADSKAVSVGTVTSTISTPAAVPAQGRTVTTLTTYLLNNATVNVKDYGALGNGVADDTAAIQAALNVLSGTGWSGTTWGAPTRSGRLYFPEGTYVISSTLVYNGSSGFSILIEGAVGAAGLTTGATIQWNGVAGGTMFYAQGMCRSTVRDLTFDGTQAGKHVLYCVQVDGKNTTQIGSPGSQAVLLDRVICHLGSFASCAGFAFAHAASNDQVDTIALRDCQVAGTGSLTSFGILILGGGNVSQFSVLGGSYASVGTGLQCANIFGLLVQDTVYLSSTVTDFNFLGANQIVLSHVHSEQGVSSKFISNTPAGGPGMIHMEGCTYNGVAPADDFIVTSQGALVVTGGNFRNTRTGASIPKFQVSNPRNGPSGANRGGLHSRGAFFLNADNTAALWPFWDTSGNLLATGLPGVAGTYYDLYAMGASFSSAGDYGGTDGTMIPLVSQDSVAGTRNFTKLRSAPNDALTDVSADATIGLKHGDTIKFKVETGAYGDADLNGLSKDSSDRIVVGGVGGAIVQKLLLSTAAGKIVPGATSLSHRNNADSADNLLITDAGAVTARLSVTTPVLTLTTAVSKIIPGATSLSHRNTADSADNLLISDAGAITVRGAISGLTGVSTSGALAHTGTSAGFFNHAPVVQAAAITAPTAPSAGYVQAEATSMKTAVDAIRLVLQNLGFTL